MLVLLLLAVAAPSLAQDKGVPSSWFAASAESACSGSGSGAFEGFTSEILLPESGPKDICIKFPNRNTFIWGPGISYSSTACSEGCCFYIPANSKKVQEIEAKTVIPTWFRAKADGCASTSGAQTTRLILNKDKVIK